MDKLQTNYSTAPFTFDIENIITMLAAYPERNYEAIVSIVSKLITEDTIDLKNLGSDLTYTDKTQMLGITSGRSFYDWEVVWLIREKGVHSPEYRFALERRLQLTRKAVLKGVKRIHDQECKEIFDGIVGPRQRNFKPWLNDKITEQHSLLESLCPLMKF